MRHNPPRYASGFISGIPLYIIAGLGIALAVALAGAWSYKKLADYWQAQHSAEKAAYAGFRMTQERIGKEAEARAKAKEDEQRSDNEAILKARDRQIAALRADVKRLRDKPPVRPDGSSVPLAACGPAGTDGAPGQSVPLAEYRALEERAALDVITILTWQEWAKVQGLAK